MTNDTPNASDQGQRLMLNGSHADFLHRFFDTSWYEICNPDLRGYEGSLVEHYLAFGYAERRSPHPYFDLHRYLDRHPEVARPGIEPLSHYFVSGWRHLHSPNGFFDPAWYLLKNPDLLAADLDPLLHYIDHGWREGRSLHPLFDTRWYLETYPDVAAADSEPLAHFLSHGWREGRRPHPLFDTEWYLARNGDIKAAGINPWLHYIQSGWREGRAPHPSFDAAWYTRTYLNPIDPIDEPLAHYLDYGWREGLRPSPEAEAPKRRSTRRLAPLLEQELNRQRKSRSGALPGLSADESRGTLAMVLHEAEVGGAPHVLKQFARWVRDHTRFGIRIVSLADGNLRHAFAEVGPLLVLSDLPEEDRADALEEFLGEDIRGVFLNSIASGKFLEYAPAGLPTVAFIHELPQVMDQFPEETDLVRRLARKIVGGGPEVTRALHERYGIEQERLVSAHSFIEALPEGTDRAARRAAAREALGLAPDRLLVMGCGLLHWRKAPETFIEVAQTVIERGVEADFVWLGGGPDMETCQKLIAEKGLGGRVRFTGYEPAVADKLAAGDIFMLSSKEDPFPLVALYAAQAEMPIVCFQKAGGIEGFVAAGSGRAVPHMDAQAMAEAVVAYASDADLRREAGAIGGAQVRRGHTMEVVGPLLLHHLREAMGIAPEVSVVVPNYNYEAYLPERLGSIADQTFQDFEVILLDDASPDNSVAVLRDFEAMRPGTRVVVNEANSGSPFVQWMRGMDMAASELIWLAEADDRCRPTFLETLLPFFDDRNMRLASCASQPVTAEGAVIGDYRPLYLDRINPGRWNQDYIATDHEEADAGLGIANSIPNASAVMFRKFTPEPEFVAELTSMRLCGDWYFYCRAIRGGLIGFSADLLNDHRRHGNTVTHKLEGSLRYFSELATVRGYLGRTYRQSAPTRERIAEFLAQDITRFGVEDPETLPKVPDQAKSLPSLLVVAPDLGPGGGQVFAISVANEWSRRGGRVVLLNVGNQQSHPTMLAKIAPSVMLLEASSPGTDLGTLIKRFDLDVIHSGIWWADRWVDNNRADLPADMPWVITMHGCHETFLRDPGIDHSFPDRMARMIERAAWVYIADKNLAVFDVLGQPERLSKVPNGVENTPVAHKLTREEIGLRPEALVLCLASRAIWEKGWREAVTLTKRLNAEGHAVDLLLLGEGPAEQAIRAEAPPHVHLMGQVAAPKAYFELADVGLLPSTFVGESLPLVLLEMMAKGLPVIATEIGEIPQIIGRGDDAAGRLIPLRAGRLDEAVFHAHLMELLDPMRRSVLQENALARFNAHFTVEAMVDRYSVLYETRAIN